MVRIYCDFDGTLAARDVGSLLFRTFIGEDAWRIVRDYLDGRITARESLRRQCEMLGRVGRGELERFVDDVELDAGFPLLVKFCTDRQIPLVVLSDGLDFSVGRILERHGFGRIPYFANKAIFPDGGGLAVQFPFRDEHCEFCGNCKRNHIASQSGDDDVVVYIGDGISDRCPVRYADVVFAKKKLIKYCQEQNISYFEYSTLDDVRSRLESLLDAGHVKRRREAVMARRALFVAE